VITNENFLAIYTMFESVDAMFITHALETSEMFCPLSVWGDKQVKGIMLYAAHLLAMDWLQQAEIAAAATSIASGQSSRSQTSAQDDLDLTTYGRQFKLLRKTIPAFGLTF
jgi:hypothetical protein